MTMLLVMEDIQAKRTTLKQSVKITRQATGVGGNQVWLAAGETFTLEELLYALMLPSANDAAVAIAIDRAGTVPAFVEQMNQRAIALGMTHTHYVTPNGLTTGAGPHDTTTARDLAKLCVALCKIPETLRFTGTQKYAFHHPQKTLDLENHNHLLKDFPGCDGLKTGWTVAGKASIATTARDGQRRVIAVVLGCDSPLGAKPAQRLRDQLAGELMTEGLTKLASVELKQNQLVAETKPTSTKGAPASKPAKETGFFDWLKDLFSF
jgi:D-alanyl-D-alanine carboxypeptidase (penicillin-binding protein 5/6)